MYIKLLVVSFLWFVAIVAAIASLYMVRSGLSFLDQSDHADTPSLYVIPAVVRFVGAFFAFCFVLGCVVVSWVVARGSGGERTHYY